MKVVLTGDNISFDVPEETAQSDEKLAQLIASQYPKYAQITITRKTDVIEVANKPGKLG